MNKNSRIILISGVSRGIGNALALRFLSESSIVFGISRKKILKKNLLYNQKNFYHLKGNICDLNFLKKSRDIIKRKYSKLDVVILNAAILGEMKIIKESNLKTWKKVIETNLISNFFIISIFYDLINKSKCGRIISLTSTAAWKIRKFWSSYSSSKAGLEVFIKILIKENYNKNLKINFIDPGRVRTDMRAKAAPKENPRKNLPPEKILDKFMFLASNKCKFSGKIFKAQNK